MTYNTFANQSGAVPASLLDDNFAQAAYAADLTALTAVVAALPSSTAPLAPTAPAAAGVAAALARVDHQHPPQSNRVNLQTGTTYTLQSTDSGRVVELSNAGAITVTVPNSLSVDFNCLLVQVGAGQVTLAAGSGATQRQASGYSKTRAQWSPVSLYVRANVGGTAAEYVLAGDMAA